MGKIVNKKRLKRIRAKKKAFQKEQERIKTQKLELKRAKIKILTFKKFDVQNMPPFHVNVLQRKREEAIQDLAQKCTQLGDAVFYGFPAWAQICLEKYNEIKHQKYYERICTNYNKRRNNPIFRKF